MQYLKTGISGTTETQDENVVPSLHVTQMHVDERRELRASCLVTNVRS